MGRTAEPESTKTISFVVRIRAHRSGGLAAEHLYRCALGAASLGVRFRNEYFRRSFTKALVASAAMAPRYGLL
jgi:hypothetical protein